MEFNGLATAILILQNGNYRKGLPIPCDDEVIDTCVRAIKQLEKQIEYCKGNNPAKTYGYPNTYNK